ncbi:MAG TPA: hypothetical protein VEQ85_06630 [Lacipirellulaceae bacterium]|nr:hypothetical protein [Lacipirellulaceae bacterium]
MLRGWCKVELGGCPALPLTIATVTSKDMESIRIETTIHGDTLYLPELRPLEGKSVEIIVRERGMPMVSPGAGTRADIEAALLAITDYDYDAYRDSHEADVQRAKRRNL